MEEARKNAFLGAGAVVAAFGASLCCILPVAVAVFGIGSAALGASLEPLRPWLAGLTALFLGFAFYQVYKPVDCAPGQACAVSPGRRRHRAVVWIAAIAAVALMAFPYYPSGTLAAGGKTASATALFKVEGMSCSGCESSVRMKVERLAGVAEAEVSYEKKRARVLYDPEILTPQRIFEAIQDLGYSAELIPPEGRGTP